MSSVENSSTVRVMVAGKVVGDVPLRFTSQAKREEVICLLRAFLNCPVEVEPVAPDAASKKFNPNHLALWMAEFTHSGEAGRQRFLSAYLGGPKPTQKTEKVEQMSLRADSPEEHQAAETVQQSNQPAEPVAAEQIPPPQLRESVREQCIERGIQWLFHFTQIANLAGIKEWGLQSRAVLGDNGCRWNDGWRRDGRKHATCISISHPNYKMFYDYRSRGGGWAVLLLHPDILWRLDCGFVEVNAASGSIPTRPDNELKTLSAFERMFQDDDLRTSLHLPPYYPTNPQAEVLVFEPIPPTFIAEIHVEVPLEQPLVMDCDGHLIPIKSDKTYFWPRRDYHHWQNPVGFEHG